MTTRRSFLKSATAGAALAALADARSVFAAALEAHPVARGRLPQSGDYLLDPAVRYLNHGSIGTIPQVVHDAHRQYLRTCESNPWLYMWSDPWEEPLTEVRERGARLLGCTAQELAITHNTTEGFNLLAQGLPLGDGDEILFSTLNHPGASNPWTHMAPRRGYRVRSFDFPVLEIPHLTEEEVVELHLRQIRPETRVLVFPHVDNLVGLRHPMGALARGARERGVEFVAVDGAQAVSMIPVELEGSGVDFYAASPHKWIQSPKGLGFLYLRKEAQEAVHPMWVSAAQPWTEGTVRRFEDYGTRNRPEVMALGDALAFQEEIRMDGRESHHQELWRWTLERVEATPGLRWRSPTRWELSAALYTVEVEGHPSPQLASGLFRDHQMVFRPIQTLGVDGARLSPNLQTPREDLEAFFRVAGP